MCFQVSAATKTAKKNKKEDTTQTETSGKGEKKAEEEEDDEEIPQLVPIATPSKKPKLQVSAICRSLISLFNLFFKVTFGRNQILCLRLVKCKTIMLFFYL